MDRFRVSGMNERHLVRKSVYDVSFFGLCDLHCTAGVQQTRPAGGCTVYSTVYSTVYTDRRVVSSKHWTVLLHTCDKE